VEGHMVVVLALQHFQYLGLTSLPKKSPSEKLLNHL
jgi:hypothetical protein